MNLAARRLGVTHLLAPARFGGLETVVASLARAQLDAGVDVRVLALVGPGEEDHPFLGMLDRRVRATGLVVPPRRYILERRRVVAQLRASSSRILHTHGYRPDVVSAPSARKAGFATVTTVHGFTGGGLRNRFYERLQLRSFRDFDAVVAVSEKLRGELGRKGVPGERLHAVPNAWSGPSGALPRETARARLGLSGDAPVIGWVGRLTPEKGPDVMIRALASISRDDVTLSVIGDGPLREGLVTLARESGVASRVRWHGMVPGAAGLLPAFDALALSSWTEGTPMVVLEAMAAGVPIVTTAVGGVPDVVGDEEAVLVPSGDPMALAAGIARVLSDAPGAVRRAEAASRRLAERFSTEDWVERYTRIYRTVLGDG